MADTTAKFPTNVHQDRLNASSRPRMPILRWQKRHAKTREAWEACKRAADAAIARREHIMSYVHLGRMKNCPPWEGETADDVISRFTSRSAEQVQLLNIVAEIVHHRGVSMSDYVYRGRKVA